MADKEKSSGQKFFSDWRNVTLTGAAILILILIIALQSAKQSWQSSRVAVVGNSVISEGDVVGTLKKQYGSALVADLVKKDIWQNFAAQQNVNVPPAEIEEYIKFTVESMLAPRSVPIEADKIDQFLKSPRDRDEYFKEMLAKNGITTDSMWNDATYNIVRARLIVPDADVRSAMNKGLGRFHIPMRFVVNQYIFASQDDAAKAVKEAKSGDGHGMETALNAQNANIALYYSAENKVLADYVSVLAKLKPEQYSNPQPLKDPQSGMTVSIVFRLRESYPSESLNPQTIDDLVRQTLLMRDEQLSSDKQKYAATEQTLFAQALNKVDVNFVSADYPVAFNWYQQQKKINPDIPGVTSDTGTPLPKLPGSQLPGGAGRSGAANH